MNLKQITILFLTFLCSIGLAQASTTPRADLSARLANLRTMEARFTQTILDDENTPMEESTGAMALSRPGKFYWNIKSPNQQLMVADGKQLWIYDKDLAQVTVKPLKAALGESAATLLIGEKTNSWLNSYTITYGRSVSKRNPLTVFILKPKSQQSAKFQSIHMNFSGNLLASMKLADGLGQLTYLAFSKIKVNQFVSAKRFRFKPPKGVDVIHSG